MTENGPRRRPRQLSPEEKWQVFVEVCSQQLSQADAARKWGVDVSTVIKLRRLAKDGALAAFAASRPGKPVSIEQLEIADLRAENDRLSEALKELAVELALHRGLSDAPGYLTWRGLPLFSEGLPRAALRIIRAGRGTRSRRRLADIGRMGCRSVSCCPAGATPFSPLRRLAPGITARPA